MGAAGGSHPRGAAGGIGVHYEPDAFGRFAESIARFLGTARFLVLQSVLIVVWIAFNLFVPEASSSTPATVVSSCSPLCCRCRPPTPHRSSCSPRIARRRLDPRIGRPIGGSPSARRRHGVPRPRDRRRPGELVRRRHRGGARRSARRPDQRHRPAHQRLESLTRNQAHPATGRVGRRRQPSGRTTSTSSTGERGEGRGGTAARCPRPAAAVAAPSAVASARCLPGLTRRSAS